MVGQRGLIEGAIVFGLLLLSVSFETSENIQEHSDCKVWFNIKL